MAKYLGEEEQGCPYSSKTCEKDTKALQDDNIRLKKELATANNTIKQINDHLVNCPSQVHVTSGATKVGRYFW